MEVAFGAASWALGKVVSKLSDDFLAKFKASENLGTNYNTIKTEISRTQGVLNSAKGTNLSDYGGLRDLLLELAEVADEADDVVDELHYVRIKDALDGTNKAAQEVTGALQSTIFHATHAAEEVSRKWFSCFSCCHNPKCDDAGNEFGSMAVHQGPDMATNGVAKPRPGSKGPDTINSDTTANRPDLLRIEISERMASLAERLPPLCAAVTKLLKLELLNSRKSSPQAPVMGTGATVKTPTTHLSTEKELYGRETMLDQTVEAITGGSYQDYPLAVLPIVGVGGIGKTTFAQHLYRKVQSHFKHKAWICVSHDFDVVKITREIYKSIRPEGNHHHDDEPESLSQFHSQIKDILKTERFLLVLDDVWNNVTESQWEKLLVPLNDEEAKGHVVLVTTRFPVIEEIVKRNPDDEIVELKGLERTEFEKLFFRCVFGYNGTDGQGALLVDIGKEIAGKLRGSPLAAKTVGRLLKKELTLQHWTKVRDSKEWAHQKNEDDIISALKLTYDYLSFPLQQCFLYCALFPDDYKYSRLELVTLWMSAGLLVPSGGSKDIETLGEKYLDELVENGVFEKSSEQNKDTYIIHDLFNELARHLSRDKFLCIEYPTYKPADIQQSVRHLSIIITQKERYNSFSTSHLHDLAELSETPYSYLMDLPSHLNSFKHDGAFNEQLDAFKDEMDKLKKQLDIKKLRTLMLFGEYDEDIAKIFQDTFKELESLRFVRLFKSSLSYLPPNFPKLLHLRGLSIKGLSEHKTHVLYYLLDTISGFYHLKVLDIGSWASELPKGLSFSRLVNLRHLIASYSVHSSIADVGKMKLLQNLVAFHVKKEISGGFELEELGSLEELGGTLSIYNLEKAKTRDEASKANLVLKRKLTCLKLCWDKNRSDIEPAEEKDVLEGLKPNPSLSELHIENHGGATCPSWLGSKINAKINLIRLSLNGVSWNTGFPHFSKMTYLEKLELRNIDVLCSLEDTVFGQMETKTFQNLVTLEIHSMRNLEKWVGTDNCCFFPCLEELRVDGCPKLAYLPFRQCEGLYSKCFPKLRKLYVNSCPLLSLPMPCTPTLESVEFDKLERVDSLVYSNNQLKLVGKNKKLEYHNLEKLQKLTLVKSSHVSSKHLKKLTSLQTLIFIGCSNVFVVEHDDSPFHLPSVRVLILDRCGVTRKELASLLGCFPALSYMQLRDCEDTGAEYTNLLFLSFIDRKFGDAYFSNLWALAAINTPDTLNIRVELSHPQLYIGNSETRNVYNNPNDILSYAQGEIKNMLAFPKRIFVDSVSGLLIRQICNRFSASVRRVGFFYDHQVQSFTAEQNDLLRRITYLQVLELCDCKNLQTLPEALRDMRYLQHIYIKNCPSIKLLPANSLPQSLERLVIENCSVELVEECQNLKNDKFEVYILT